MLAVQAERLAVVALAFDEPEAAPTAARPRVEALGCAREAGRNPNDRRLDSYGRSTMVDSAVLHATFSDTKLLVEKWGLELPSQSPPRLTAQTEGYEIEVEPSRSSAVYGADHSITRLIPKRLTRSEEPNCERSDKMPENDLNEQPLTLLPLLDWAFA